MTRLQDMIVVKEADQMVIQSLIMADRKSEAIDSEIITHYFIELAKICADLKVNKWQKVKIVITTEDADDE